MYMAIIVLVLSTCLSVYGFGRSFGIFEWARLVAYMLVVHSFAFYANSDLSAEVVSALWTLGAFPFIHLARQQSTSFRA